MAPETYDIITVGGGLGGSALAKAMAERGARVLVLESEARFRDRVRGEAMMPWGTMEARELGIYDTLIASGGHELPWWDSYRGPTRTGHRDFSTTTTPKVPALAFYHPGVQEGLLEAAASAGAEVRRGARVRGTKTGDAPTVVADISGRQAEFRARLVVGADGRTSMMRGWSGFTVRQDAEQNLVAGVLYEGIPVRDDACHFWLNSSLGLGALLFPQGHGQVRAYLCYGTGSGRRLSGDADLPKFVDESLKTGVAAEYYTTGKAIGPLATFDGASTWVDHPYRKGVALIGDAAAASDPTWGQGLSLTLRDVRVLRDQLLRHEDWDEAGNAYAREHDRYYGVTHTMESWMTQMLMQVGPEADPIRERALPLWREDRSRLPDTFFSGPEQTLDEAARRRFFGEE
jgi:2-polyprenyl-6-methoxyphenol hydroxylase-like FAD-dependent oxidoreductase